MRRFALVLVLSCCRQQPSGPPPMPSTTALALATAAAATLSAPAPVSYDTSCKKDWECAPAPSCCPVPCSSDVINERELDRARADMRCDPTVHCPSAGGCVTFAYLCVDNACKIVFSNEPGFRPRAARP